LPHIVTQSRQQNQILESLDPNLITQAGFNWAALMRLFNPRNARKSILPIQNFYIRQIHEEQHAERFFSA